MLSLSEKVGFPPLFEDYQDRITWEEVFNSDLIKIEESRIKRNFEFLLKDKEDTKTGDTLNRMYID